MVRQKDPERPVWLPQVARLLAQFRAMKYKARLRISLRAHLPGIEAWFHGSLGRNGQSSVTQTSPWSSSVSTSHEIESVGNLKRGKGSDEIWHPCGLVRYSSRMWTSSGAFTKKSAPKSKAKIYRAIWVKQKFKTTIKWLLVDTTALN